MKGTSLSKYYHSVLFQREFSLLYNKLQLQRTPIINKEYSAFPPHILTSDGTTDIHRANIPSMHNNKR